MNKKYNILVRFRDEISVIEEHIDADQIDSLVMSLNLLSDYGEVYYKMPVIDSKSASYILREMLEKTKL